ncbi:cellobiohydrolase [Cryobacterium melibiosiphilum]|uniref:Glucanase n=1 Tax=Cryobacterium melibiosiphilum TaxID=995039 RepID=A0A3A5MSM1_9MICO|nr:glycoside hydrolase family 6 protein [Cryobacterium melibiosiphilum]RJT92005.1 cellobiohydrolase [Cryobacterium melibiosiphilum]
MHQTPNRGPRSGSRLGPGLLGLALAAPIAAMLFFVGSFAFVPASENPLSGRSFFTSPDSDAAAAADDAAASGADSGAADAATPAPSAQPDTSAAEAAALTRLAAQPTATWILPERHPLATVQADVSAIVTAAQAEGALPVIVIYGIPNRDCGNYSAGGLSDADYPVWVDAIAAALVAQPSVVIVEPDALALTTGTAGAGCANGTADTTIGHVRATVDALAGTLATVYIDGGHSNWVKPAVMAALLDRAGIDSARGFATNVSNYNADAAERAYGDAVSKRVGGAHYVVDTSRNGNGNGSTGEWCNPTGRALGAVPGAVTGSTSTAHDANLWIKPPGESDGLCNGGPAAGQWWPERALELAQNAGW